MIGAIGAWQCRILAIAAMMVLFLNAARLALVVFDPYLSSRPLAEALLQAPAGTTDRGQSVLHVFLGVLLYEPAGASVEWPRNNLEYGSYAPGAPDVFIDDAHFAELWQKDERYYVLVEKPSVRAV